MAIQYGLGLLPERWSGLGSRYRAGIGFDGTRLGWGVDDPWAYSVTAAYKSRWLWPFALRNSYLALTW
jgi:hypothetical protein